MRILLLFAALSLIRLRHSWCVSPLSLLPVVLLAFIFVVSNFLFLTLSHILVIFFITISAMFKILTSNYVTWSGRLIVYLQLFQELVLNPSYAEDAYRRHQFTCAKWRKTPKGVMDTAKYGNQSPSRTRVWFQDLIARKWKIRGEVETE